MNLSTTTAVTTSTTFEPTETSMKINAVLVRLRISSFPNTRTDQDITSDVKKSKKLGEKAGKWIRTKLPEESLAPIAEIDGQIRAWHRDVTLPWEAGVRLLPVKSQAAYDTKVLEWMEERQKAVNAFFEQYPQWIKQAKLMHNGTFDPADYPEERKARDLFVLRFAREPVPLKSHFSSSMAALYGESLEEANQQRVHEAHAELYKRCLDAASHMAERLAQPKNVFRDTLVENVKELLAVAPDLNLINDPVIAAMVKAIDENLTKATVEELRSDPVVRKAVAEKAEAISKKFGALGKGRVFSL